MICRPIITSEMNWSLSACGGAVGPGRTRPGLGLRQRTSPLASSQLLCGPPECPTAAEPVTRQKLGFNNVSPAELIVKAGERSHEERQGRSRGVARTITNCSTEGHGERQEKVRGSDRRGHDERQERSLEATGEVLGSGMRRSGGATGEATGSSRRGHGKRQERL